MVPLKRETEELPRGVKYAMELQRLVYEYVEKEMGVRPEGKFKATGALMIFFNADKETHLMSVGLLSLKNALEHILAEILETYAENHG